MEQSYVMLKPGYGEKENEIMGRLLRETNAKIIRRGCFTLSEELLCEHYAHIVSFAFFTQSLDGKPSMKDYMLSGEVIGFVLEGEDGLVERIRKSIGATKATEEGTIRYDYISDRSYTFANVIHASGNVEEAKEEIERFAPFMKEFDGITQKKRDKKAFKSTMKSLKNKTGGGVKSFFSDFKKFISKGNIIDLAVALVIGTAFTAIVTSLVNHIIMPLLGMLIGSDWADLVWEVNGAKVEYGKFILAVVNFFIIALCVFTVLRILVNAQRGVKKISIKKLFKKKRKESGSMDAAMLAEDVAAQPEVKIESTEDILKDIRTLLLAQQKSAESKEELKETLKK